MNAQNAMPARSSRLRTLAVTNWSVRPAGSRYSPWVHGFALLTAASILVLICSGGLVTSKGAGLTVPDWPTSYGYNMFTFPVSRWVGGVLYEHAHRLIASGVGLLTVGLAIVVWWKENRAWVRWLALVAVVAVVCQGVLGGLRVTWLKDSIGIFHACLAQAFLAMVSVLALVTSRGWLKPRLALVGSAAVLRRLRLVTLMVTALIYGQLALGASMRHAHAGLSISDFPTAYGQVWPATDVVTMARINAGRDAQGLPPTTPAQIYLQMAHRLGAFFTTAGVLLVAGLSWRHWGELTRSLQRLSLGWPLLIATQVMLGVYTIWTNKAADVATAHVAVGALSLVWGVVLSALLINDARAATFAWKANDQEAADTLGPGQTLEPHEEVAV